MYMLPSLSRHASSMTIAGVPRRLFFARPGVGCFREIPADASPEGSTMSSFHAVPAADLELLRKYDTPTVCNVVELFDLRPRTAGYMDGRIQACFPKLPPMVGYAATATFRAAAAPRAGNVYSGMIDQVA